MHVTSVDHMYCGLEGCKGGVGIKEKLHFSINARLFYVMYLHSTHPLILGNAIA